MDLFKKLKCNHVYHETRIERYNPILGGRRKFICKNCKKSKWIYIPKIHQIIFNQEDSLEMGINLKDIYIRNKELEEKDHYRKRALE